MRMHARMAIATAQTFMARTPLAIDTVAVMVLLLIAPMINELGEAYSDSTSVTRTAFAIA